MGNYTNIRQNWVKKPSTGDKSKILSPRRVIHQEITVMYTNSKEGLKVNEKNIYRIEEKQTTIIMEDFVMPYLMMNRKTDQRGER